MNCLDLFPTPILILDTRNHEAKNEQMLLAVAECRANDPGIVRSNVSGWHSSQSSTLMQYPVFKDLGELITHAAKRMVSNMGYKTIRLTLANTWVVVSPHGASNTRHAHPRSFLSGAYYIQAGAPASPIIFYDPRREKTFTAPAHIDNESPYNGDAANVEAKAGRLLIFPSWLEHSVPPNMSQENRVVFSFNILNGGTVAT